MLLVLVSLSSHLAADHHLFAACSSTTGSAPSTRVRGTPTSATSSLRTSKTSPSSALSGPVSVRCPCAHPFLLAEKLT